jgi:hypothetical protein
MCNSTVKVLTSLSFLWLDCGNMRKLRAIRALAEAQQGKSWLKAAAFLIYVIRTVHFGMKLYYDKRNAQVFNLFIYLLLPYMFRVLFEPIFRGRYTTSAVVQVSWVGFSARALAPYPEDFEPPPKLYTCCWRWAKIKPETCKTEGNSWIN